MILRDNEAWEYIKEHGVYNEKILFSPKEFTCKCGCGGLVIDTDNLLRLLKMRIKLDMPIIITSAYRCEKHNKSVGGVKNSTHVQGKATDITVKDFKEHKDTIIDLAEEVGFTGIGKTYINFVHVDNGDKRSW